LALDDESGSAPSPTSIAIRSISALTRSWAWPYRSHSHPIQQQMELSAEDEMRELPAVLRCGLRVCLGDDVDWDLHSAQGLAPGDKT
jgi:hypothetical protein